MKMASEKKVASLFELTRFDGSPRKFWPQFLERLIAATGAQAGAILIPPAAPDDENAEWRCIALHPMNSGLAKDNKTLERLSSDAIDRGWVEDSISANTTLCGLRLGELDDPQLAAAVLHFDDSAALPIARQICTAASTLPYIYRLHLSVTAADGKVGRLAQALEIGFAIQSVDKFREAVMTVCNELSARFGADRVCLGWVKNGYVQVTGVSHTEKVDRKMELARGMERIMEESLDQDLEVVVPTLAEGGVSSISRDHEAFAHEYEAGSVASIPIRLNDRPVGIFSLERKEDNFTAQELETLRLVGDQIAAPLEAARIRSLSPIGKSARNTRNLFGKLLGFEHTLLKLLCIIIPAILVSLAFIKIEHRLRADFVLRTNAAAQLSAPYPGFIEKVGPRVGELVKSNQVLVELDRSELLLQQAELIADEARYLREAQKAETGGDLAEMRVSKFKAAQSAARLKIVRYRLDQSVIRAPFDGILIEGGLEERIAAPVQQGELLARVVQIRDLYSEVKLDERDMPYLKETALGEIAFASRPDLKFPVTIQELEPIAAVDEKGTSFLIRGHVADGLQAEWWRPGMTGVCKINAGQKSILWILGHRTVEFLRLVFWI